MFGITFGRKFAHNEVPASVFWSNDEEDDIVITYESGLYYNHDLNIAVAETDSLKVHVTEFTAGDRPADPKGDILEFRTDPDPVTHSCSVWEALKTQNEITKDGARPRGIRFDHAKANQWTQIKIWSFMFGLLVLAAVTMWSLKLHDDTIDLIADEIERKYQEQKITP